jgi:hypothetical protein
MRYTTLCAHLVLRLLATGHCGAYEAVRTARFLERLYFNPN